MELKKINGFSLIELIVVIGLLSLLMLAISSSMLMSIISSNRIRTTTQVKQAGNYTLDQIQGMIRNAESIESCSSINSTVTIMNHDGGTTTFSAIIDGTVTRVASNSGTFLTPKNLTVSSFSLTCIPDDTSPTLIKVSFGLKDQLVSRRATENPLLYFETSVSLRNE